MKGYIIFRFRQIAVALGLVAVAFGLRWVLDPVLHDRLTFVFFLLATIAAAWVTGVAEAALVLGLGWLIAVWWFNEPRYTWAIKGVPDWLSSFSYWAIGGAVLAFAKAQRSAHLRELRASVEVRRREAAVTGYRTVFDLAPVGLAEVEPQSGLFLHVNPKLCQLTGCTAEEMVRKRLWEVVAPVEGASDWATLSRRLLSQPAGALLEMNLLREAGGKVRLGLRATLAEGSEQLRPRLVCVLEEWAPRREAEATRAR